MKTFKYFILFTIFFALVLSFSTFSGSTKSNISDSELEKEMGIWAKQFAEIKARESLGKVQGELAFSEQVRLLTIEMK